MKKTLLMTCTLLALAAGIAAAGPGGLNLSWTDCGAAGTQNAVFSCANNVGTDILVGSYVTPCCAESVLANEIVVDLQTAGGTLAAWWSMRGSAPLGCRSSSLAQSGDFTVAPFNISLACYDYWQGGASGGVSMDAPVGNRARIKALEGVPTGSPLIQPLAEGTQVYSFQLKINHAKTVGTGSCAGCQTPVCIVLNSIKLNQTLLTPGGDKFISAPALRSFVTYQGGPGGDCYGSTPAKNTTWGGVKALYR